MDRVRRNLYVTRPTLFQYVKEGFVKCFGPSCRRGRWYLVEKGLGTRQWLRHGRESGETTGSVQRMVEKRLVGLSLIRSCSDCISCMDASTYLQGSTWSSDDMKNGEPLRQRASDTALVRSA